MFLGLLVHDGNLSDLTEQVPVRVQSHVLEAGEVVNMRRTSGFTMIELLVVIAIIGILSAIIFPTFAAAKLSAYKNSDISSMNSIRNSIQLYREDQGAYPPALLGYITPYQYDQGVVVVPAEQYRGPLFPKKVDSLDTLRGSQNRVAPTVMVPAIWPGADIRALGAAPIRDLNGDGAVNAADDVAGARQAYSSDIAGGVFNYYNDSRVAPNVGSTTSTATNVVGRFYAISGYDVSSVPTATGGRVYELRYTQFWTGFGLGAGSAVDDPRQLGYSEPPAETVVTWNSAYRNYRNGSQLTHGGSKDIVLFLGGSARPVDSRLMAERSWRFTGN
jgi:prepilin-type N-terminal cleavage/methylation domain-containing protein